MCKIDVSAGCATGRADGEAEKNGPCRESHPVTTDFEAEVGALTRMIEADPTDARYYCERGCLREQIGDLEGALADYARCIELDPENPVGHCLRGAAQERRRPPDSGILNHLGKARTLPGARWTCSIRGVEHVEEGGGGGA